MFSRESTSYHTINSDFQLNAFRKSLYFVFNALNFFFDFRHAKKSLVLEKFHLADSKIETSDDLEGMSISRYLSDSFWASVDYNYLREILGSNLRVVDVGCGSGKYSNILRLSDEDTYLGVDISRSPFWLESNVKYASFQQTSYLNVNEYLAEINLLVTQSAIEHFEYDLLFFKEIQKYVEKSGQPLIQIHLFPAKAGLWTGLLHGIRQYSLRMVLRIVRASKLDNPAILVLLGGKHSNMFHWDTVTKYLFSHKYYKVFTSKNGYIEDMLKSVERDEEQRNPKTSTFFALVIQHNLATRLTYRNLVN
jgi:hypothetical protein